jgi:hypothetical protein
VSEFDEAIDRVEVVGGLPLVGGDDDGGVEREPDAITLWADLQCVVVSDSVGQAASA